MNIAWFLIAVGMLATGVAIATSLAKRGGPQMSSFEVPSRERLFNLEEGSRVVFEGQSYVVFQSLVLYIAQALQQWRYTLYNPENHALYWLVISREGSRERVAWQQKIASHKAQNEGEFTLIFQGTTYTLEATWSGTSTIAPGWESGFSLYRYDSQEDTNYLVFERFGGGSWELALGREIQLNELGVSGSTA